MSNVLSPSKFVLYSRKGNKLIRNPDTDYVWMTYKKGGKIRKLLKYTHPAINDENQDLCGGWHTRDPVKFEEVDRVLKGLKPLGASHHSDMEVVRKKAKECEEAGFMTSVTTIWKGNYMLTVSPKGKLGDFFDMDAVAEDYRVHNLVYAVKDILGSKETDFSLFHDGKFDDYSGPITGLILGYPIENTISIMM